MELAQPMISNVLREGWRALLRLPLDAAAGQFRPSGPQLEGAERSPAGPRCYSDISRGLYGCGAIGGCGTRTLWQLKTRGWTTDHRQLTRPPPQLYDRRTRDTSIMAATFQRTSLLLVALLALLAVPTAFAAKDVKELRVGVKASSGD